MEAGHFTDYVEAGGLPCFLHILKPFFLQALEGVGGGSGLVGASADECGAGLLDRKGGFQKLVLGFNGTGAGHDGHGSGADMGVAHRDDGILRVEFLIDQFIGLSHGHNLVNAFADLDVAAQKPGLDVYKRQASW